MKLLLHTCCAPCSVECVDTLREQGMDITAFWYNPNIHPYKEYEARRDTLIEYAKSIDLPLLMQDEYGLRKFISALQNDFVGRCTTCYQMRFEAAAKCAAENGFEQFTSTLFISPYQHFELMKSAAQDAAQKYHIHFYEYDFRPLFRAGQNRARAMNLYMQKYCGCVFSEEDRYLGGKKKKTAKKIE